MTCKTYQTELSAYLDGELPAARAARLEAHLRVCPHCQGELQELSGISRYIRAASQEARLSQHFDQRVLRSVTTYQLAQRTLRRRSLRRPIVIATVVLLTLLSLLWQFLRTLPAPAPTRMPQPSAAAAVAMPFAHDKQ